jgi:hypothetical protein
MAKQGFGCERPECASSSGIDGSTTFGTGKLDANGFWEFPCEECGNAWRLWQKWGEGKPDYTIDELCKAIPKDKKLNLIVPTCNSCLLQRVCTMDPHLPAECTGFVPRRWRSCICLNAKWWY